MSLRKHRCSNNKTSHLPNIVLPLVKYAQILLLPVFVASLKLPFLGKFSTKRKDRGIGAKLEGQGGVCYRRAEFYRSTASLLRRNQSRSFAGCLLTWWENIIHQILSSEYRSLEAAQISGLSKGVLCTNRKYYSPWCITCVSSSWEKIFQARI